MVNKKGDFVEGDALLEKEGLRLLHQPAALFARSQNRATREDEMSVSGKFKCVLPRKDHFLLMVYLKFRGGPIDLSRSTKLNDSELVKRPQRLAPQKSSDSNS